MPSAVAGIVERGGGFRVVVTQRWRMRNHVKKGERLFVVPGLEVEEPVPYEKWGWVIGQAQQHATKMMAPVNACGECRACCKTLYVKSGTWTKPSHSWCPHCVPDLGCKIHFQRPTECRVFECRWLKSQKRNDVMPPELRPDRCGVILTDDSDGDPLVIEMHVDRDRPGCESKQPMDRYLTEMEQIGFKLKVVTYYYGEGAQ